MDRAPCSEEPAAETDDHPEHRNEQSKIGIHGCPPVGA
jgi:hypothetical protein